MIFARVTDQVSQALTKRQPASGAGGAIQIRPRISPPGFQDATDTLILKTGLRHLSHQRLYVFKTFFHVQTADSRTNRVNNKLFGYISCYILANYCYCVVPRELGNLSL